MHTENLTLATMSHKSVVIRSYLPKQSIVRRESLSYFSVTIRASLTEKITKNFLNIKLPSPPCHFSSANLQPVDEKLVFSRSFKLVPTNHNHLT